MALIQPIGFHNFGNPRIWEIVKPGEVERGGGSDIPLSYETRFHNLVLEPSRYGSGQRFGSGSAQVW